MKNDGNSGNENAEGLDARSDAALWNLLGRADQPKAGPYFARRVLREVSLHTEAQVAARWWQPAALWRVCRRLPRLAFVVGTPVAALLLLFVGLHPGTPGTPVRQAPAATPAVVAAPAASHQEEAAPAPMVAENVPAALPAASVAVAAPLPEEVSAQDVEVIAELDTLLKREQSHLWTDDDTARF